MPCHHNLDAYLHEYVEAAGLKESPKSPLFRPARGRSNMLTEKPLDRRNAWAMVRKRARAAGILTSVCNHSFRATGITEYLRNGGQLKVAQAMAGHSDPRTTELYDRNKMRCRWTRWSGFSSRVRRTTCLCQRESLLNSDDWPIGAKMKLARRMEHSTGELFENGLTAKSALS